MYKGIFWCYWSEGTDPEKDAPHIIATRVLCDADGNALEEVEFSSKRGTNFNHKKEWKKMFKDAEKDDWGMPLDDILCSGYFYFPRGRVEVNKGKIIVFANPIILCNQNARDKLIKEFKLENMKDSIRWKADNSEHYKYVTEWYIRASCDNPFAYGCADGYWLMEEDENS